MKCYYSSLVWPEIPHLLKTRLDYYYDAAILSNLFFIYLFELFYFIFYFDLFMVILGFWDCVVLIGVGGGIRQAGAELGQAQHSLG